MSRRIKAHGVGLSVTLQETRFCILRGLCQLEILVNHGAPRLLPDSVWSVVGRGWLVAAAPGWALASARAMHIVCNACDDETLRKFSQYFRLEQSRAPIQQQGMISPGEARSLHSPQLSLSPACLSTLPIDGPLLISPCPPIHLNRTASQESKMGESRTELIAWLNDLLALNYTKVEQCGSGAAYAQVIDSIYGTCILSWRILLHIA